MVYDGYVSRYVNRRFSEPFAADFPFCLAREEVKVMHNEVNCLKVFQSVSG